MNRAEYLNQMRHHLRRLPKEDFNKAIQYFEEYLDEAGQEHEEEAIQDLGALDIAAAQIIRDLAVENAEKPNNSVKRGLSTVQVGILAIFAAPIGVPLAFAAGMLVLAVVLTVVCLLGALCLMAVVLVVAVVPLLAGSTWLLFVSPINGIASLGMSLLAIGIGVWIVKGCIWLSRWVLNGMTKVFGKIAKRGQKHEKQK